MTLEAFKLITEIFQVVIMPILLYVGWIVRDIRTEVRKINMRITRLEAWKEGHEKWGDAQLKGLQREIDQLRGGGFSQGDR